MNNEKQNKEENSTEKMLEELIFRTRTFFPENIKQMEYFDLGLTKEFKNRLSIHLDLWQDFQEKLSTKLVKLSFLQKLQKSLTKLFQL